MSFADVVVIVVVSKGLLSSVLIDNFGLRYSIILGVWLNFLGASVRALSAVNTAESLPIVPQAYKYTVLMLGQSACAIAQPFVV